MLIFNEEDFLRIYRGSERFVTKAKPYIELFRNLLKDEILLEKIKFANDYLFEAPLKAFIYYCRAEKITHLFNNKLETYVKQGMGACFGYLYRFIYNEGYAPKQCLINDKITGIKTASRFEK